MFMTNRESNIRASKLTLLSISNSCYCCCCLVDLNNLYENLPTVLS